MTFDAVSYIISKDQNALFIYKRNNKRYARVFRSHNGIYSTFFFFSLQITQDPQNRRQINKITGTEKIYICIYFSWRRPLAPGWEIHDESSKKQCRMEFLFSIIHLKGNKYSYPFYCIQELFDYIVNKKKATTVTRQIHFHLLI